MNENEFTDSLFSKKTCSGYYKAFKNKIKLFDKDKNLIGVITKHKVLAKASKMKNGQYWYNYAEIELIGEYKSYLKQCEDINKALEQCQVNKCKC